MAEDYLKFTEEELKILSNLVEKEFYKTGTTEDNKFYYELHGKICGNIIKLRQENKNEKI